MKEIDVTIGAALKPGGAGMVALLHVLPPSMVRKISVVVAPFLLAGITHAIREESTLIFQTLILRPEELSGVTSLQRVPPLVVRSSNADPSDPSVTAQPVSPSIM